MPTPAASQHAQAPKALRRNRRRRCLLPLLTILVALGWSFNLATWFVHTSSLEFTENRLNSPAYPTAAQMHSFWAVYNGFFYLNSPRNVVPAVSPNLAYPDHFTQIRKSGVRYRLTLVRYASSSATIGSTNPAPTFTHEFSTDSPTATPHLLALIRFKPDFDAQDLWRWEYSRRNGILITFPLWALLMIPTLALTPAWIQRWRSRSRARQGLCAQCGYNRAGLKSNAPCPECGGVNQMTKEQMTKGPN